MAGAGSGQLRGLRLWPALVGCVGVQGSGVQRPHAGVLVPRGGGGLSPALVSRVYLSSLGAAALAAIAALLPTLTPPRLSPPHTLTAAGPGHQDTRTQAAADSECWGPAAGGGGAGGGQDRCRGWCGGSAAARGWWRVASVDSVPTADPRLSAQNNQGMGVA